MYLSAVQVTFRGNGELGQIQTVATAAGLIKGRVANPACDPPLRADGKLAVGTAVGAGAPDPRRQARLGFRV